MAKFADDFYSNMDGQELDKLKRVIELLEENETSDTRQLHEGKELEWHFALCKPIQTSFTQKKYSRAVFINDYYSAYFPASSKLIDENGKVDKLDKVIMVPHSDLMEKGYSEGLGNSVTITYHPFTVTYNPVVHIINNPVLRVDEPGGYSRENVRRAVAYVATRRDEAEKVQEQKQAEEQAAQEQKQAEEQKAITDRRSRLNAAPVQPEEEPDMGEEPRTRVGRNAGVQQHRHERVEQVEETVQAPVEPEPAPRKARTTSGNAKFSFDTAKYIISVNTIPDGFVFLKPAYYAYSATMSLGSVFGNAGNGYAKAYNAVLAGIQAEIDKGEFDALFNMRVITKDTSDSTEYDCVIYGDACIVAE
ncbi:hypothetical protein [Lacticaseibacillus daqingensis]|uniref:hypothetical protein n=1 Tax=Lacticaseibacillus daqingensis TaxID=2486014 RepID=UPI000F782A16|nr:hypothetical protein [Lacticaseibacillus daqingensis]